MNTQLPNLPQDSLIVQAIYDAWKKRGDSERSRGYLGASSIGVPCDRALWYSFRHCGSESFDGRMYRLFDTGHKEEARFAQDLRDIGCIVHLHDEEGRQFAISALAGHFKGHMDAAILGVPEASQTWHVGEFKTHSAKSFAELKRVGVKESKPEHYAQMMVYMKHTGMKRALYLAKNKDTDELYSERIRFNAQEADAIMARAQYIITSATPPERMSSDPEHFKCRMCSHRDLCHGGPASGPAVPLTISCRNCVHSTPEMDGPPEGEGRWSCAKHHCTISREKQDQACDDHLAIPGLVVFARQVDAGTDADGNDWIEYRNADGTTWRQGRSEHYYSTRELTQLPGPLVGAGTVQALKDEFGVELIEEQTIEEGIDDEL